MQWNIDSVIPDSQLQPLKLAGGGPLRRAGGFAPVAGTPYERIDNRAVLSIVNPSDDPVEDELVFRCYRKYRHDRIPGYYRAGIRSFDRAAGRLLIRRSRCAPTARDRARSRAGPHWRPLPGAP